MKLYADNMKTIKEIYRIGHGPSSSHTMAPRFASEQFLERHPEAARFEVTLYGSREFRPRKPVSFRG